VCVSINPRKHYISFIVSTTYWICVCTFGCSKPLVTYISVAWLLAVECLYSSNIFEYHGKIADLTPAQRKFLFMIRDPYPESFKRTMRALKLDRIDTSSFDRYLRDGIKCEKQVRLKPSLKETRTHEKKSANRRRARRENARLKYEYQGSYFAIGTVGVLGVGILVLSKLLEYSSVPEEHVFKARLFSTLKTISPMTSGSFPLLLEKIRTTLATLSRSQAYYLAAGLVGAVTGYRYYGVLAPVAYLFGVVDSYEGVVAVEQGVNVAYKFMSAFVDVLTKGWDVLLEGPDSLSTLHIAYAQLLTKKPASWTEVICEGSEHLPVKVLLEEYYELEQRVNKCAAKIRPDDTMAVSMTNLLKAVVAEREKLESTLRVGGPRIQPFAVLLSGEPQCGKTTFSNILVQALQMHFNLPSGIGTVYVKDGSIDESFWEGYSPSQNALLLQELAASNPNLGKAGIVGLLTALIDSAPYPLNMAFEDKGKVFFDMPLVVGTTNVPDLNAQFYVSCPKALRRRFISVDMRRVDHEVGTTDGRCDADVYTFDGSGQRIDIASNVKTLSELTMILVQRGKAFIEEQKRILKDMSDVHCSECKLPRKFCLCKTCVVCHLPPSDCVCDYRVNAFATSDIAYALASYRPVEARNYSEDGYDLGMNLDVAGRFTYSVITPVLEETIKTIGSLILQRFGLPKKVSMQLSSFTFAAYELMEKNNKMEGESALAGAYPAFFMHLLVSTKGYGTRVLLHGAFNYLVSSLWSYEYAKKKGWDVVTRMRWLNLHGKNYAKTAYETAFGRAVDGPQYVFDDGNDDLQSVGIEIPPFQYATLMDFDFQTFVNLLCAVLVAVFGKQIVSKLSVWHTRTSRLDEAYTKILVPAVQTVDKVSEIKSDLINFYKRVQEFISNVVSKPFSVVELTRLYEWRTDGAVSLMSLSNLSQISIVCSMSIAYIAYMWYTEEEDTHDEEYFKMKKTSEVEQQGSVIGFENKYPMYARPHYAKRASFPSGVESPFFFKKGRSLNDVVHNITRSMVSFTIVSEDKQIGAGGMAHFVAANVLLLNTHYLTTFGERMEIRLKYDFEEGVSPDISVFFTKSNWVQSDRYDYSLLYLPTISPREPKLLNHIPSRLPSTYKPMGAKLLRLDGGQIDLSDARIVSDVSWYPDVKTFGFGTDKSEAGLCGSVYIASTDKGYFVVGLHAAGVPGVASGVAIPLCVVDIKRLLLELKSRHTIVANVGTPVAQSRVFPLSRQSELWHNPDLVATVHGTISGAGARMSKSKLVPTSYSRFFEELFPSTFCPPNLSGSMVGEEWLSPISHSYSGSSIRKHDYLARTEEINWYIEIVSKRLEGSDYAIQRVLSIEEAVFGCPDRSYVDPMNFKTSAGFPYSESKKHYVDVEAKTLKEPILTEVHKMLGSYRRGRRCSPVFRLALKDEPVTVAKASVNKARVFACSPMAFNIVFRMYYQPIIAFIMEHRFAFGIAVGMNALSPEWGTLYKFLTFSGVRSEGIVAGDYSRYDKNMSSDYVWYAFKFLMMLAKKLGYTSEELRVMSVLASEVVSHWTIWLGDLVLMSASNPSGQPATTIINSIVNVMYLVRAYSLAGGIMQDAWKDFHFMVYGDDNIFSDIKGILSHSKMVKYMAIIGQIYTSPDKNSVAPDFYSIEHATFLKRGFVVEAGRVLCPLERVSFQKSCHWLLRSNSETQANQEQSKLLSLVHELSVQSVELYSDGIKIIQDINNSLGYQVDLTASREELLKRFDIGDLYSEFA
jgi:hypothetical protein